METAYDFLDVLSGVCIKLGRKTPEIDTSAFRRIGRFYLPDEYKTKFNIGSKKPVIELAIYEKVLPQEFIPEHSGKMVIESLVPSIVYLAFEELYKEKFESLKLTGTISEDLAEALLRQPTGLMSSVGLKRLSNLKLMTLDKTTMANLKKIDAELYEWIDASAKCKSYSDVKLTKSIYSVVENSNNLSKFLALHESLMRFPLETILAN